MTIGFLEISDTVKVSLKYNQCLILAILSKFEIYETKYVNICK